MTGQDISGNALEYAVAMQMACIIGSPIKQDAVSKKAREDFMQEPVEKRIWLMHAAGVGIAHIMQIEKNALKFKKESAVIMQPDNKGQEGDPRDVLLSLEKDYLGVSVKRNNAVAKNPRLQRRNPNFGKMWGLGANTSSDYAEEVEKVFKRLDGVQKKGAKKWSEVSGMHGQVYLPLLNAFAAEFKSLAATPPVAKNFVEYMTGGAFNYYKIMAYNKEVVVQGYNFGNKLSCGKSSPPKSLLSVSRKDEKSKTTLILAFEGGWAFSMRIHNATTNIEDSLKWAVCLIAHPVNMYSHHILL